jgi:hypothetical protein
MIRQELGPQMLAWFERAATEQHGELAP